MSACVFLLLHEIQILILKSYSIWLCIRCPHHGIQWRICLVVKLFWQVGWGNFHFYCIYLWPSKYCFSFRFLCFTRGFQVGTLSWLTWHTYLGTYLIHGLDIYPHAVFVNRFEIIYSKGFFKNIDWNPQFVQASRIVVLNTTYTKTLFWNR